MLEPVWTIGPILPPSLVEVLAALDKVADSNNEEDGEYEQNDEDEELEEIDLEDLFSDD